MYKMRKVANYLFPHSLHITKVVIGSSADRVWSWLYVQFLLPHLPHFISEHFVPSTCANCASLMPSLINASRCFFTSSEAISSDVITAIRSGAMTPQRTFSLNDGFFLSLRLKTLDLTWFLYLGLVLLLFLKMVSSMSSASSSGVLTIPSGSSPSPMWIR